MDTLSNAVCESHLSVSTRRLIMSPTTELKSLEDASQSYITVKSLKGVKTELNGNKEIGKPYEFICKFQGTRTYLKKNVADCDGLTAQWDENSRHQQR